MSLSLDNLHNIYIPESVGFFPLTEGYIILIILTGSIFISLSYFLIVKYLRLAYKRQAIKELQTIKSSREIPVLFTLIKRILLSKETREDVASLSGVSLLSFIQLENEPLFVKANSSIYDSNIVLSDDEFDLVCKKVFVWLKVYKGQE